MRKPVEDGIAERWVGEADMPVLHRDLCGDQGGGAAVAIVDDLQEIAGLGGAEPIAQPIVQN